MFRQFALKVWPSLTDKNYEFYLTIYQYALFQKSL